MKRSDERVRTAIVTGATRGLGREIASQLLDHDYRVFFGTRDRSLHGQEVDGTKGCGVWIWLEVDSKDSIESAKDYLIGSVGSLDLLINNAGIYSESGNEFSSIPLPAWKKTMEVNCLGPLVLSSILLSLLSNDGNGKGGRIVNITSGNGFLSGLSPEVAEYSLSKFALNGACILMAKKFKDSGVMVNAICPGWLQTDMGGDSAPRTPREGAADVLWLCELMSQKWITGRLFQQREEKSL